MATTVATTITPSQVILSRKDHKTLFVEVTIPRLNFHGLPGLLFNFHEFIPEAVCYLAGRPTAILLFQDANLLII